MSAHGLFSSFFATCLNEVPFNPQWPNGTGYLDGVCHEENLVLPGQVVKATDPHGRKVLIAGTRQGPAAIFERYTGGDAGVLVFNFPAALDNEASDFPSGAISEKNIDRVFFSDKGVVKNRIDEFMVVHSAEEVD